MNLGKKKVYFKGLHALRFFAAVFVLISHVEMIKGGLKVNNIYGNETFFAHALESLGPMGVTFFFVLSGFLITYLLLVERSRTNTVNIKSFYMRRALRIWPIYILFTLIAFFLLPEFEIFSHYYLSPLIDDHKSTKLLMYLLFVPGFVLAFFKSIPWAGHLWSIGVEEQFYLAWPWLFKLKKRLTIPNLLKILFGILIGKAIFLGLNHFEMLALWAKEIVAQSKFECMIIGGIGALVLFQGKYAQLTRTMTKTSNLFLLASASIFITWFMPDQLNDITHLVVSPLFLLLILGVSQGQTRKILEHKYFIFLGNISYGFYLYHMVCVVLIIKLMPDSINYWCAHNPNGVWLMNILYYVGALILTTAISAISYQFVERPFLRLKTKFAVVKSGKS